MSATRSMMVLLLVAATWASTPAAAQNPDPDQMPASGSRAALLEAERAKKTTESAPPVRGRIEKALYRYDNDGVGLPFVFRPWHGLHLAGGTFPAGAGLKFGVGYTHDLGPVRPAADPDRPNRFEVDSVAAYSTRGYLRGGAGVTVHHVGGAPLDVRVHGQHYEFPQEDFFGFGQDSDKHDRTNYLFRNSEAGVDVHWYAAKLLDLSGGVSYLRPGVGRGTDNRFPSSDALFDPATIPGYQKQPDFLRSDASVALDWRDNPLFPHTGGRYGVTYSNFQDRDLDSFDFRRITVDLQQYIPLPDRYRTIALHAAAVFSDPRAGQTVPFYFEPTLGGAQALRGFREFRFHDRNSLLMTAEYRWEAWWALDGAFFIDAGKVERLRKNLDFNDLDVSYGFGLRFHSNRAFVARLDLAFSREGFIPLLRFEHVF